jgi:hypothetical protein
MKYWDISYRIDYPSGKVWRGVYRVSGLTEGEAISTLRWLKSDSIALGVFKVISVNFAGYNLKGGPL